MEVSFLQIQRNYKIRFFKKIFFSYFNEKELEDKNYEHFMKWCYTRQTKKNAGMFCKTLGISKANINVMIKMVNLMVFSKFHPVLFENKRTKEIEELSNKLCELRVKFFDKCLYCCLLTNRFSTFQKERKNIIRILSEWEQTIKKWKEIDKCMLVQDCIIHYVELMNLDEQLKENDKSEKTDKEKELNKITRERIIIEKEKCKDRVEEIDGGRGLRVMKEVLQHISNWEKSEKKLQEQIRTQMEEAFWNRIKKDIEMETYELCQLHIKELVEDCASLFNNNVSLLDRLVDQLDFEFMKYRCENKTADAKFWYSTFIHFVQFLEECDAKQMAGLYENKIEELYLWTDKMSFNDFKHMFLWIKDRIEDILERKREYETSDSYQDLKKERVL